MGLCFPALYQLVLSLIFPGLVIVRLDSILLRTPCSISLFRVGLLVGKLKPILRVIADSFAGLCAGGR